jgi:hypothetical protein
MDNISHNDRIKLAIADLESQESLNYIKTAEKWNVNQSTLSRRYRGVTGSQDDHHSYVLKVLTDIQKDVQVRYINKLSARDLLSTP